MNDPAPEVLLHNRYPGPRSFKDDDAERRMFFGRDQEIESLTHRVRAARLLVLFGKSGLGKTSLLQAGLYTNLREYDQEIDRLIERNQLDEAIAHSRHILQVYPKHLDTYRLLGKSYLEAKRYGDAADIFQRVLSAVPDDFIAASP